MDIRSNIINSMIFSLKRCTNKNKYVLLLNELLSLFPLHAEKSLRLCLKSKIKKYTLIKEKGSTKDYPLYTNQFRGNKRRYWKNYDECLSDSTYVATAQKRKKGIIGKHILRNLKKKKSKKTPLHFFVVCGNNQKYLVFKNFCSCFYFKEKVLCNDSDIMCKHILSVLLAESFNNYVNIFLDSSLFFDWFMKKLHT
ncbi:zinc finger protein [Plasmodium gonderi]|uniref:Zinc finger protein n=1 Tax=Plasmodium gonderi TaxID=77519 RepID=A0A1Y1JJN2_PLAGO|nr:zinc finger protein [Plasmodium gonderi]GAW80673.1 zinc finger protein [Plasmodium gonderi]